MYNSALTVLIFLLSCNTFFVHLFHPVTTEFAGLLLPNNGVTTSLFGNAAGTNRSTSQLVHFPGMIPTSSCSSLNKPSNAPTITVPVSMPRESRARQTYSVPIVPSKWFGTIGSNQVDHLRLQMTLSLVRKCWNPLAVSSHFQEITVSRSPLYPQCFGSLGLWSNLITILLKLIFDV